MGEDISGQHLIQVEQWGGGTGYTEIMLCGKLQVAVLFAGSMCLGAWERGRHRARCTVPALG